ncbi:ExbD/TolR family protein [Spiribacter halobius]|uniref:Biopolymer transporter ExbD n=1 Tax=Sediminicurvatus halobius TaxID=2182432 RepID=A0A2U2N3P0_9GAMM|nr:biopolymer transporter ExbD [Spiribacter halobius]PWG63720.1 biopolymer transporter ExbD [Spiribacter halobius]UEX79857.1 biopolymer transporter ExbD [Spiribacter halobius]
MIGEPRPFEQQARPRNDDERILPLINVVFLLLIFFMIAGQLSATDAFRVEPAESRSEGRPEREDILVLVGADGRLAVDDEEIAPEALVGNLRERLEGQDAVRVRLKADARAAATEVVAIMEQLRSAGVERLQLLTVPER